MSLPSYLADFSSKAPTPLQLMSGPISSHEHGGMQLHASAYLASSILNSCLAADFSPFSSFLCSGSLAAPLSFPLSLGWSKPPSIPAQASNAATVLSCTDVFRVSFMVHLTRECVGRDSPFDEPAVYLPRGGAKEPSGLVLFVPV